LYDVLNIDAVPGNATVNASGFNVTCGYMVDTAGFHSSDSNFWTTAEYPDYAIRMTRKIIQLGMEGYLIVIIL
jgi:hypothetical protein